MTMTASTAPANLSAERRQLTIMFCDVVGSTALATRLDPEDLDDVFRACQERAKSVVEAAGGRIARYQGDGVLAYFGYPEASEDDAERAVNAGLELARGIAGAGRLQETVRMRVGIASGVVLVGGPVQPHAADNPPVVGETANLAARLQELADPETVVICDSTHRLVGGMFEYDDLGLRRAKGLAEPIQAWRVVARRRIGSRFQALRSRALPYVGREAETALLLARWAEAKAGAGRVVVVSGDAGIGKSRAVLELLAVARREQPTVLRYDCSPQHRNSVLHPLLEQVRRAARAGGGDGIAVLERLRSSHPSRALDTSTAIALLSELLMPAGDTATGANLDVRRKREVIFEALIGNLQTLAHERPLLVVIEDAHWIDPSSSDLVDLFVGRMAAWRILFVITCRPGYLPSWQGAAHASRVELKPISADQAQALIRRIPGAAELSEPVVQAIAVRADGIPLYIEELTKAVLESGGGAHGVAAIPSGLHASLTARLDRLGTAKHVARVAAALGREFTFDLLHAVMADQSEGDVRTALQLLVEADLLTVAGAASPDRFVFRHALIQDTAYGMLPRGERKALHERIARALSENFPQVAAAQPEIVADHFTKAGLAEPAIRFWTAAGDRAVRSSALVDAAKHYSEAIRLTRELPPSPERDRAELKLHLALGPAVMATKGYAAPETLQVFQDARELAGPSSAPAEQLEVLAGLFNVHYGRAELDQALATARKHMELAEKAGQGMARAHCFMGQSFQAMGSFAQARRHFERTLAIFQDSPEDTRALGVYGSQCVVSLAFLAGVYWALGDPEKAADSTARSIDYAVGSGHLISIALARVTKLLTPIPGGLKGDRAEAEELERFCAQHGLANFEVWARFARGATIARRGDGREAIAVMQAAIKAADSMGSLLFRPVQLATLASTHAKLGEPGKALALLDEALAVANRTGEKRADSALHRLRGDILAGIGKRREAARAFAEALRTATSQGAVSEVERTRKSMARLGTGALLPIAMARRAMAGLRALLGG